MVCRRQALLDQPKGGAVPDAGLARQEAAKPCSAKTATNQTGHSRPAGVRTTGARQRDCGEEGGVRPNERPPRHHDETPPSSA
jgi:hypothetical protein